VVCDEDLVEDDDHDECEDDSVEISHEIMCHPEWI
jgi:hypothetical protein